MSQVILLNESTASNRIVYLWSLLSNGTSPAQFETGGQPEVSVAGIAPWSSAGTLLAIDTTNGEYCVRLGTSDVSVAGPGILRYSSSSALETSIPFQIIGYNPYDGTKLGLTSVSTFDSSVLSVGLKAVTHSAATVFVGGIDKAAGAGSGLSFLPAPGDYGSTVTVGVDNIAKSVGAISGLSFLPAPGTYSGVSVSVAAIDKAVGATSGLSFVPAPGNYSTVSVAVVTAGIPNTSFAAGAIDSVALATSAENGIADQLLGRNIQGGSSSGNSVGSALAMLRNRVQVDGSTLTVFKNDGVTSWFTASVATVSANSGILVQVTTH